MNKGLETLSEITTWSKYAKYIPELKRRENWTEIVQRYLEMMSKKYPDLEEEIWENGSLIFEKKILPSMRALQFAGLAVEVNPARLYNCAFYPVDHYKAFSEAMFLLLGGTGVGYSVQYADVAKLPEITKPTKKSKYVVQDSIVGWADAVKVLMKAYLGYSKTLPIFDFRDIRPKGARLVTAGGKAPGAEPLKECLFQIQKILDRKENGDKLSPLECHDILCHIANSVLSGGIRRAALISLFSFDDEEMLTCKHGAWWELNGQRGRANNSAVIVRNRITKPEFLDLWKKVELSNSGEPGISWTNNPRWGFNPCHEVSLRPFQFCNLCEINASSIENQEDFNHRAKVAAFFGTLQAGFTDFHYLRPIWKETTEKDALIGVGITGIADHNFLSLDEIQAANKVLLENERVANIISINKAARATVVKPSGTTSCVLGTSSGIHAWHDNYYLRTTRYTKTDALAQYLQSYNPEICETDEWDSKTLCVRLPIEAPEGAITREESVFDLLERVKRFNLNWVKPGHRKGDNINNVSATISVKPEQWVEIGDWMWENREHYSGISVLPYDNGSYVQAPFETLTEEQYVEKLSKLKYIDINQVEEEDDNVQFTNEVSCAGGACEIV